MPSFTHFVENGLNVSYLPKFFEQAAADSYLNKLSSLFYQVLPLKISGSDVVPQRQILAYGDANLTYSLCGFDVPIQRWSPLMFEIRCAVEKQLACTYNFVLINFFSDDESFISSLNDEETITNSVFPTAILSFGEKRTLEFKKSDCDTFGIELEHGSLYILNHPTEKLFTCSIPVDKSQKRKSTRISLTFKHLICDPVDALISSMKKLKIDDETTDQVVMNDWTCVNEDNSHFALSEFNLCQNTFACITLDNNKYLRLHIRDFKEMSNGYFLPTSDGIQMNSITWCDLAKKIHHLKFNSTSDSVVVNNQLLVLCLNKDYCLLQQMFKRPTQGFYLKPDTIQLSKDQILKLIEKCNEITESFIEMIFTKLIPALILNKSKVCYEHLSQTDARTYFLTSILNVLESSICNPFIYDGCVFDKKSQFQHGCILSTLREKFTVTRQDVLLNFNVYEFIKTLKMKCTCYYTNTFFEAFDFDFYNAFFEKELFSTKF